MGDFHWKELGIFLAFAAAVFIGYGFLLSPPGTLCPIGEPHCYREWIGALSGWAAAVAAAVTVYFLSIQNMEQKKQTDFILGDAPPTFDILPHRNDDELLIARIVNWNRRAILVHGVESSDHSGFALFPVRIAKDGQNLDEVEWQQINSPFHIKSPIIVPGWEDRAKPPHHVQIKLIGLDANADRISFRGLKDLVEADITVVGTEHKRVPLFATMSGRPKTN